jgi:NAD(P)H dehydrogenase (quinone)
VKHAIIVGHPNLDSFNLSVARAYQDAVIALGHDVVLRDLYRSDFDPRLQDGEIPRAAGFEAAADVQTERALIGDADVFVFVYPLWFNVPPAIVTGYVQRVFGLGFGYAAMKEGPAQRLLFGRQMISFSSSASAAEWLRTEGSWSAIQNLFDEHLSEVCGLTVLDRRHFGRVAARTPASRIEAHLREVREVVSRHFAGPSA